MVATGFKAVVLAGGSGERFWPLSTPARPKQFLSVFGGRSLLRQTVERFAGLAGPGDVYVVATKALAKATRRELPELPAENVAGEPCRRDTAAAVALGVGLASGGSDPVVGFFPSDHLVARPAAFRKILRKAIAAAKKTCAVVVIGVKPTYPATAFGYVDPATSRFTEKPDAKTAEKYVREGRLWNAGIFVARSSVFRAALEEAAPQLARLASPAAPCSAAALARIYAALPRISFDYAVMESISRKPGRVAVVPGDFGWDDVGGLASFDKYYPHDAAGNVLSGDAVAVDSGNNICVSQCGRVALLGVNGLAVISTPDGVLVADKRRLGDMKLLSN